MGRKVVWALGMAAVGGSLVAGPFVAAARATPVKDVCTAQALPGVPPPFNTRHRLRAGPDRPLNGRGPCGSGPIVLGCADGE